MNKDKLVEVTLVEKEVADTGCPNGCQRAKGSPTGS